MVFSVTHLFAQGPRTIKGKVTDENGGPLAEVTVIGDEGDVYTTTDKEGNYTIAILFSEVVLIEKDGFIHITYHMWSICVPAVRRGNREGIPLFRFLKEPLIRRFGEDWYTQLVKEIQKIH